MRILSWSALCIAVLLLAAASLHAQTVTGSGTSGYVPLWTGASKQGNSLLFQKGTQVAIGGTVSTYAFSVKGPFGIGAQVTGGTGVSGVSDAASGIGLYGESASYVGVWGTSTSGNGIFGFSTSFVGVHGESTSGQGVYGKSSSSNGVKGYSTSGIGVYGVSTSSNGVRGDSTSAFGVYGTSASSVGVYGVSKTSSGLSGLSTSGAGVYGSSTSGAGVHGASTSFVGVQGASNTNFGVEGTSATAVGVGGNSTSGYGVQGVSSSNVGVLGVSTTYRGVVGQSTSKTGVVGMSATVIGIAGVSSGSTPGTSVGVLGVSAGDAALFNGAVGISGTLAVSGFKAFKIDHPLDPANKYLMHAAIESSEVLDMYSGKTVLDSRGEAAIQLPEWFETLNADFRYQLTAIGQPAPNLYVAEEIHNNQLRIAGGNPGMKVSWQVTGIRQDAYMKAHPMPVESEKPDSERGYYLHPELFGQAEERGVIWAHHPDIMQEYKANRLANQGAGGSPAPQQ